ncbi:hypothetical protein [Caenispirillum salinarum]|uniref:phage head spike fiber domain-containing protein n=1 Tax=Caenispirillum salinarum TaxID=859058 RepID=UPI00384AAB38
MTLLPRHYPGLVLAARPGLAPPRLEVVRDSPATRVTATGLVEEVGNDVLRDDFDRETGAYQGWLVEPFATNHLPHGRDMGAGGWARTGLTAVKDRAGADGIEGSGCRLRADAANATVTQALSLFAAERTFSVDILPLTVTGAVSITVDGGASWTAVTSLLRAGRFTRVTLATAAADPSVGIRLSATGDSVVVDFAQLEDGPQATSRIATGAGAVSRAPDRLTVRDLSDFWNAAEGALIVHCRPLAADLPADAARQTLVSVGDSSAATDALLELKREPDQGDRTGWAFGTSAGYGAGGGATGAWSAGWHRIALGWTAGESDPTAVMNGSLTRTALTGGGSVSAIAAETGVALALGHQRRENAGRDFCGHVGLLLHYPRRLPDADLIEATQ